MKSHAIKTLQAMIGLATAGIVLLLAGSVEAQLIEPVQRTLTFGVQLSGHDLNGVGLNGEILDGKKVRAVSFHDAERNGEPMRSVWLHRTRLRGFDARWRPVSHRRMEGTIFTAELDDGELIRLRIEETYRDPDQHNRDLWLYRVSYQTDSGWLPLCGVDDGGDPIAAIPLQDVWDYSQGTAGGGSRSQDSSAFTFACRGHALAKCVEAGYKPWKRTLTVVPGEGVDFGTLAAHHQACTRMLRADYCGDGTSHTENDTLVNIYDDFGVRRDDLEWSFEAEWDEHGAICAVRERISGDAPDFMGWLVDETCGDPVHFDDGVLLMSEIDPSD